jgi:hypothetical protein
MNKTRLWIVLAVLAAAMLACDASSGTAPTSTPVPRDKIIAPIETATPRPSYNTEFPLPDDVSDFFKLGTGIINFQTKMSLKDTMAFYRDAFGKQGYKERELLTVTSDTTFNLVFDGHKSGKAIIVQGVEIDGGNTNVSIHLGVTE